MTNKGLKNDFFFAIFDEIIVFKYLIDKLSYLQTKVIIWNIVQGKLFTISELGVLFYMY